MLSAAGPAATCAGQRRPAQGTATVAAGRRFVLGPQIGRGGFADVYRALDLMAAQGPEVAVKVLRADATLDAETISRFGGELTMMSKVAHPNVMPVLASGADVDLGLWFAMPLALGSLFDDLQTRKMPEEYIVAVMRDICAGLDHIHRNGVLHRDLKPENVLRSPGGTWAIADFGLARDIARTTRLTETGRGMGSRFYVAPEQVADAKNVTVAADIYSAGKILQALLVGGTPVNDDVPPGKLASVVRRAISGEPGWRHQSAAELLSAIEAAIKPTRWESAEDKANRLRMGLAAAIDTKVALEVIEWADTVSDEDIGHFALALSAMPDVLARAWWDTNPANFTHVFGVFGRALDRFYRWDDCDLLANFARQAVNVTGDQHILREAVRGLAVLGSNHNRWYVRDVTVAILQRIRDDADATSALEGLRIAGPAAAQWTAGHMLLGTLHPILHTGIPQISPPPTDGTALQQGMLG